MGLMDIFGPIEKWVNEHASAAVLGQHVGFLRDQVAATEKRLASLAADNDELRGKLADAVAENVILLSRTVELESRVGELETVIDQQRDQVAVLSEQVASTPKQQPPDRHNEACEKILQIIASRTGAEESFVIAKIGLNHVRVVHFLDVLRDAKLISRSPMVDGAYWYLTAHGRRYLVDNGLDG